MSQTGSAQERPLDGATPHGVGYLDVAGVAKQTLIEAIASSSEGFALFDADDRLILCNDHFRDFHPGLEAVIGPGATFQAFARAVAESCIVRPDGLTVEAWLAERMAHYRQPSGPLLQQRVDGRWVQVNERRTNDGGVVAVYTDVTGIKRADAAVRTTQGRLSYLLTASPSMICSFEVGGRNAPTFISENVRDLLGYEPEDYLSGPEFWLDRLHPDDRDRVLAEFPNLLREGHNVIEYRFRRADGTYRWVRDEQRLLRDEAGRPVEVVEAWSDITTQKEAEQALQKQTGFVALLQAAATAANEASTVEEALRFCLDRIALHTGWPIGLAYRVTGDGGRRLSPTGLWHCDAPERFARFRAAVAGATPEAAAGAGPAGRTLRSRAPEWILGDLFPADDPRAAAATAEDLRAGFAFPVMVGREVVAALEFFACAAVPPDPALLEVMTHIGAQLGRVVERQRAAETLRQAKEAAEDASRAKSSFLANMSHELRTPLNAIIGFTRLVMRRARDVLPVKQFENLEKILASSEHLLSLINSILDLAKVEAGRMEVKPSEFALGSVLDLCLRTVEPLVKHEGVRLVRDAADPGLMLRTDEEKLRQILINLLSNAIKFTEAGSVTLRVRPAGDSLEFAVTDTGIGIPAAALSAIFEEFHQVDNSATRSYGGTGLGLAISHRLARLLGGGIDVASAEGQGSTFTLTIPARIAGGSEPAPGPPNPIPLVADAPRSGAKLVLAIDDDPNVVYLLQENLADAGYTVVGAASGQDGLRMARALQPRAITLDIMMPGTDGWQVLHALKTDPLTRDIPVVLISIVDQKELGYRLGATDYIVKPFEREALISALARLAPDSERVLVIDDDPNVPDLVRQLLDSDHFTVDWAADGAVGLERIAQARPSVILLDLLMPRMDGLAFLDALQADPVARTIPVVVLTAAALDSAERGLLQDRVLGLIDKQGLDRAALIREVQRVLPPASPDLAAPDLAVPDGVGGR